MHTPPQSIKVEPYQSVFVGGRGQGPPSLSHLPYPQHLPQHLQQPHVPAPMNHAATVGAAASGASSQPAPIAGTAETGNGSGTGKGTGTNKGTKRNASGQPVGGGNGAGGAGGSKGGGKSAKEKKTRSKAACSACKSVKQKCEGPPFIPCRRCELYKLECKFPPGTKTVPRPPEAESTAGGSGGGAASADMNQKLYEILNRLQSIESALHIERSGSPPANSASSPSVRPASPSAHSSDGGDMEDTDSVGKAILAKSNPFDEINQTIESVSGRPAQNMGQIELSDYGAPDVLRRGTLTPDECQQLFDFFFASLHPWIMMLSLDDDRNAMAVRQRSTLLFHTILLLSTAYSSPFPSQLHLTLVTYLNNIIAPQLINPQPHELNTDFIRTFDLLTLYKPVQFSARRAEGLEDADAMRVSKVNGLASWMLQTIFSRTAERLELPTIVGKFAKAYSASANGTPIPKDIVRDLRLYYWLLSNDVHGNVQSGRRCNMEGAQALTTTRLFSSLQLQPYDVRLAASVEMFEVARPILRSYNYERTRRIPRPDLERFNQGMKTFDETWIQVLIRQLPVDPLAMTVVCPFAAFIILQFNATCYVSWKLTRMFVSSSDSGDSGEQRPGTGSTEGRNKRLRTDGPRPLSDWEFDGLTRCVKAAEQLVFTLAEESRVPGAWRAVQWEEAERADGWRKLILDEQQVEHTRWGMDAVTCVAYVFPLVFLSKLVNDGLLTTNLTLLRNAAPQPAWAYTQKLPRLLELGAAFLDAIATNAHHPSHSQAHVLRTLLDTGIRGRLPTPMGAAGGSPSVPRNAATVMSPSPKISSLPYLPPQPASYPGPAPSVNGSGLWPPPGSAGGGQGGGAQYAFPPSAHTPPSQGGPPPLGLVPGMDEALGTVLSDFEPLFGESAGGFWEWGGFHANGGAAGGGGGGGGGSMQPPPPVPPPFHGGVAPDGGVDWAGALPTQPHPHNFPPPHQHHMPH